MSGGKTLGYDISGGEGDAKLTEFQQRVLGILGQSHDVYRDRSAVYKDNFRSVGRVMVALFPEGRPPLVTAEDYDRWHIFELLIVKLTRYANNYDQPHEDSLLDQLPYLGILGALDQELRERQQDADDAISTSVGVDVAKTVEHKCEFYNVGTQLTNGDQTQYCECGKSRMVRPVQMVVSEADATDLPDSIDPGIDPGPGADGWG